MTALLEIDDLSVSYKLRGGGLWDRLRGRHAPLRALDGVSLRVSPGDSLGIVGESGCGKTTLARAIVGLVEPGVGALRLRGDRLDGKRSPLARCSIQMVFQDPTSSLNPAHTVETALSEPLRQHDLVASSNIRARCLELLSLVELPPAVLGARPRELSGGQRQRVAIARALAVEPDVLVADEAVAALDVSVQAAIVKLFRRLRAELGLTLIFISHDLAVVSQLCSRVAVMYLGRVVEEGPVGEVLSRPAHPYTRVLLDSVPDVERSAEDERFMPRGEPPSPIDLPSGCRFHPRCPLARDGPCTNLDPVLREVGSQRSACHFADEMLRLTP